MENSRQKKRAAKTEEGTITLNFCILPSQRLALIEVSERENRSISSILRKMISVQIEKWREEGVIE
jgi:hypothetical protein